jgi:hypothetical protein
MRSVFPPYARLINLQYHANIARWSDPPSNTIFGAIAKPTTSEHWPADAVFSLLLRCYCTVLFAVIPSFMPTANQGFCGEPDFAG